MLDSGCSDHIMHDASDFSTYRWLPTLQYICLADGNTHISYLSVGTVSAVTCVKGIQRQITLHNVIHSPDLGGHFISIWKIGTRGITTMFTGSTATLNISDINCVEGWLIGQQYWLTLQISAQSVNSIQHKLSIEKLHAWLSHLSWSMLKNSAIRSTHTPYGSFQHVEDAY